MQATRVFRAVLGLAVGLAVGLGVSSGANAQIVINEVDSDTVGTDALEFVELYDGGVGNMSLTGLVVVFYNGSNDLSYAAFDLDGFTTNAQGYFVLGNSGVNPPPALVFAGNLLQNGADAVAVYSGNASDFPTGTPVTTTNLIDAMVYDTDDADDPGLLVLLNAGQPQVNESGTGDATVVSNQRIPNGAGGPRNTNTYQQLPPTPGAASLPPVIEEVAIFDIQGAGHSSPLVGRTVRTTGIVTAVDSNGFYLQDPTGDSNEQTSDGIFVFTSSPPTTTVSVGASLEVTGTVTEFIPGGASTNNLSITEITSPSITVLSHGNSPPAPVVLGQGGRVPPNRVIDNDNFALFDPAQDGMDFFEALEGMRVTIQNALAVSPLNSFGEIFTVVDNGASATGLSNRRTINISPDDFNPERVQIQLDSGILPGFNLDRVNVRDRLGNVTGVVGYNFGNYEVNVTAPFSVRSGFLQPESTLLLPFPLRLRIAGFNVLNLDPNVEDINLVADNDPDEIDDDVGNGRFRAVAAIIVNNLRTPDIIALQEVQDNNGAEITDVIAANETLQLLVDSIANISRVNYQFIDNRFIGNETSGGQPGGNIRTAFLYNPARVQLDANSVRTITDPTDQQTNPNNPFFASRLPLVATFRFRGEDVTVVNNHFTSKGGSSPLFGQIQPSVATGQNAGQENPVINGGVDVRREQAQAVIGFVNDILAANPRANVIVLGDLNEFEFISPLNILAGSLLNLTETLPVNERYSFIFDGNSQSLDHILISSNLALLPFFDIVHVNSESTQTPARASDHEPTLASLFVRPRLFSSFSETLVDHR